MRCDDVLVSDTRLKQQAAVEQVALHVFQSADISGQFISRRMVAERLDQLAAPTTAGVCVDRCRW